MLRPMCRALALASAAILLGTGLLHQLNPYRLLGSVISYDILPPDAAIVAAMLLPAIQIVVGIALLFRFFVAAAESLAIVLFSTFVGVQVSVVVRQMDINCGCYGTVSEVPVGAESITLAAVLLLVSVLSAFVRRWVERTPEMH